MLKLYENIKRYRIEAKMSQAELAARVGYTDRSSIAKIEKGAVDLSQSKIKQFADVFGVSSGQLMGWDQDPEELADITAHVLLQPQVLRMIEKFLKLPAADQATVSSLVDVLAEKIKKD